MKYGTNLKVFDLKKRLRTPSPSLPPKLNLEEYFNQKPRNFGKEQKNSFKKFNFNGSISKSFDPLQQRPKTNQSKNNNTPRGSALKNLKSDKYIFSKNF